MTFVLKLSLLLVAVQVSAGEIKYFSRPIEFWPEEKVEPKVKAPVQSEEKQNKFEWGKYLDPKNKEFFREGEYTPPEPFMEIARNPSDENIKKWFEFMKLKNELAQRLDRRIQEYQAKQLRGAGPLPSPRTSALPVAVSDAVESDRFRVRMYFESTCPACKRMFGVLKRLQEEGVEVHALQLDKGPLPQGMSGIPIEDALPEDVEKHRIDRWPFILVADLKRKVLLPPIQGYQGYDQMMNLLKAVH